jgi:uncharacterized protein YndB with AHSA1/START domain
MGPWVQQPCEVLAVEPERLLGYSSAPGTLDTTITRRLEPEDGGTRLHLEHDGFMFVDELIREKLEQFVRRHFWDAGFRDRLQSNDPARSPLKIWDGFTFTLGDGGATITQGESFRYWISFR